MNQLHDRFAAWLIDGATGDPPRDAALHASGCHRCLSAAAALDSLQSVDIGALPAPPVANAGAPRRVAFSGTVRAAASAAGALVVGTAFVIAASSWLGNDPTGTTIRSPGEGVLAGGPSEEPEASASLEPTDSPRTSLSPSPSALETPAPLTEPTVAPRTFAPAPTTAQQPVPVATPRPTTVPTTAPTPAPIPTASPSPTPTPVPSPSASPSPSPDPSASSSPVSP